MEKKEFTVRELTMRGWKRREDLDFRDDGTKFKAFEYTNGLIATYTKGYGEYYLALRVDYIGDLVWEEYSQMDSYKLADEFNGVTDIDADKVCQNAVEIMNEYKKVLEEVQNKEIDMARLFKQIDKEKIIVERLLEESNLTLDDLDKLDSYDVKRLREYRQNIKRDIDSKIDYLVEERYTHTQLRQMEYRLDRCGYLVINMDGYYIKTIKQIIAKLKMEKEEE